MPRGPGGPVPARRSVPLRLTVKHGRSPLALIAGGAHRRTFACCSGTVQGNGQFCRIYVFLFAGDLLSPRMAAGKCGLCNVEHQVLVATVHSDTALLHRAVFPSQSEVYSSRLLGYRNTPPVARSSASNVWHARYTVFTSSGKQYQNTERALLHPSYLRGNLLCDYSIKHRTELTCQQHDQCELEWAKCAQDSRASWQTACHPVSPVSNSPQMHHAQRPGAAPTARSGPPRAGCGLGLDIGLESRTLNTLAGRPLRPCAGPRLASFWLRWHPNPCGRGPEP